MGTLSKWKGENEQSEEENSEETHDNRWKINYEKETTFLKKQFYHTSYICQRYAKNMEIIQWDYLRKIKRYNKPFIFKMFKI